MCLFRSCGFHVCDRQPGAASWPVAMSTHQPELCCLAELVHLAFCCVEGAHPHVSPKASLSGRQTCASLVQVLGAVVGGLGSSFRSLTEWGPWGGWCNLTGFGGPRRRLRGAGGHLPLPHSCQRGAVGMGSGSTHCFSRPRLVSQVIFPVTAFSDSKTQTLGIGAFCPFCPEKTRLQSAWCLCVGLEHAF